MAEAYIVAAARTAGGRKGGRLAGWHPADLAAAVLDSLVERSGAAPERAIKASSTDAARSAGCQPASRPPLRPPAVRAAATM